ncbi:CopG family transcriptional regulator [Pseudactinotalea sp. Z1739]|uniref:ribbon-helix-helix domain-containing protein n=1 Tax=Pseudactinotalea sp. Z1739 TaxID=3413028 RepID=UPI003C7DAFD2
MRRTNIYLEERQTERLDHRAAQEGISRAELIRRLLDQALDGPTENDAVARTAIDLSFGVLADLEAPVRESGDREEHLNRIWQASP